MYLTLRAKIVVNLAADMVTYHDLDGLAAIFQTREVVEVSWIHLGFIDLLVSRMHLGFVISVVSRFIMVVGKPNVHDLSPWWRNFFITHDHGVLKTLVSRMIATL